MSIASENPPTNVMDSTLRSNLKHLYADVFWFGVLAGSTLSFIAIYASRMNASVFQIGLLTAGPAIVNLFISLPAGRWISSRPLVKVTFVSSIWHRLAYLVLIPLPLLAAQSSQIWLIILLYLIMSIPGTILAIAFNAMFAEVVPPDWRGQVVGWRNALIAIGIMVTSLTCGQILDRVIFPLNYQIVFGIGAVGALLSSYHLNKVKMVLPQPAANISVIPVTSSPIINQFPTKRNWNLRSWLSFKGSRSLPVLRQNLLGGSFGLFMIAYFSFYTVQHVPFPLFPQYYVHELHLMDSEISVGNALFFIMMLIGSLGLNKVTIWFGHRRLLVYSAFLFCSFPLLIGLAKNANLYWVASFWGGGVWAILNGGLINRLMERVPVDDRPAHMAFHNLALNLGMLAGSLLGPILGTAVGVRQALYISAGLRLLGAILLGLWG